MTHPTLAALRRLLVAAGLDKFFDNVMPSALVTPSRVVKCGSPLVLRDL